ncbi:MAG: 4Fe-4S dicluster domain-containing protein [Chloroflexi bacterium]|nr:4Fe-4S dicluster domain-containing protein [Chloroflexota bacterium]
MTQNPISNFELRTSNFKLPTLDTSNFALCFQCSKCSAGCPIAEAMDYLPHQLIKMVQVGLTQDVLRSSTIWLCAGCLTCAVRCPMEIDLPQVMHGLCAHALADHVPAAEKRVAAFYNTFLDDVRQRGRVHELRQLLAYKIKSNDLLSDIGLGVKMLRAGRLALKPESVESVNQVKALFDKFEVGSA